MKNLLKIVAGGFAVFMVLAMAQEWRLFTSAWFGSRETGTEILSAEDRRTAGATVRLTLDLMRHLYLSGGDSRFADRMPAAEGLIEEMLADIEYLRRNKRVQEPSLLEFEVVSIRPLDAQRVEVRTRERWRFRVLWAAGMGEAEAPRNQSSAAEYLLVRSGAGWRVEGWRLVEPGGDVAEGDASAA